MKYLMLFALILGVDLSTSYADLGETSTTPIDAQALKNRRLFFDAEQRELRSRDKKLVKSTARPSVSDQNSEAVNTIKLNADKVLHCCATTASHLTNRS